MTNYFFARLLDDDNGRGLHLHVKFTDDCTSAMSCNPEAGIQHSVQELVDAVKNLDTTDVTLMALDIDHSFNCHDGDDSVPRQKSLVVMDEFFVALHFITPDHLQTLKLLMDDSQGLSSTDAFTISQKVGSFFNVQLRPFPNLTIIGQSHTEDVRFFKVELSKLTALTHLVLDFVKVDGSELQTLIAQAKHLKSLILREVIITNFKSQYSPSDLFSSHSTMPDKVSLCVSTKLCFGNHEGSRRMWRAQS